MDPLGHKGLKSTHSLVVWISAYGSKGFGFESVREHYASRLLLFPGLCCWCCVPLPLYTLVWCLFCPGAYLYNCRCSSRYCFCSWCCPEQLLLSRSPRLFLLPLLRLLLLLPRVPGPRMRPLLPYTTPTLPFSLSARSRPTLVMLMLPIIAAEPAAAVSAVGCHCEGSTAHGLHLSHRREAPGCRAGVTAGRAS